MADNQYSKIKNKAKMSITLLILALITITTATYAWFTIVNNSTVNQISLDVTAGLKLRVDTEFSVDINDYTDKITNEMLNAQIDDAIGSVGYTDFTKLRLMPLTSGNGIDLYTQNANNLAARVPTEFKSGGFLQFTLWFMSSSNMDVYLNEDRSVPAEDDGTYFRAANGNTVAQNYVIDCVRMSATPYYSGVSEDNQSLSGNQGDYTKQGATNIYEPNKAGTTTAITGHAKTDAGGATTQTAFDVLGTNSGLSNGPDKTKVLFKLKENIPAKVTFKLWIEGEDLQCINSGGTINIEKAKFLAMLRFCGAGTDGAYLE